MTGSDSIAEELTQEAFIKAWKGLSQFGFKSSLKTWIFQVAINVGRDWLRSHKVRSLHQFEVVKEFSASSETLAVQEALLEIEDETRELLVLFYYEGMKLDEMSEILKIPEGTVKSRLHSARSKLKEKLMMKGFDV
jgi:RNA polymerase sigma-70 factor (ECF subfamily)